MLIGISPHSWYAAASLLANAPTCREYALLERTVGEKGHAILLSCRQYLQLHGAPKQIVRTLL